MKKLAFDNKSIKWGVIVVCALILLLIISCTRYRFGNYKTIENDANHYLQMDDSNITKLIENWSKNVIMALYFGQYGIAEVFNDITGLSIPNPKNA